MSSNRKSAVKADPRGPSMGCFEATALANYTKLNKVGEGTYGTVFRAQDKKTGEIVALKQIKLETKKNGFPLTSTREINILKSISRHDNIVQLREVCVGEHADMVFLVFDYCEHDVATLVDSVTKFSEAEIKRIMLQILSAVAHLHANHVMHRDLKLSNLLMNAKGAVKVADFGLARRFGIPLKDFTPRVVTLWYRAPELLLGSKHYHTAVDIWAVGCMFGEFLRGEPLMPGTDQLAQLQHIFTLLGTPNEKIWPGFSQLPFVKRVSKLKQSPYNNLSHEFPQLSKHGLDLFSRLLTYDPSKRITAARALSHPYFREHPYPVAEDMMPTFPSQHSHNQPEPLQPPIANNNSQSTSLRSSLQAAEATSSSGNTGAGMSGQKRKHSTLR